MDLDDQDDFHLEFLEKDVTYNISDLPVVHIKEDEVKEHFVSHEILENLYGIMNCVHELFTHYHIPYWLSYGSLLGACRHNAIIPWDDDLDVCCFFKDQQKIIELESIFSKNGYIVDFDRNTFGTTSQYFMKVYQIGSLLKTSKKKKSYIPYPFMDIFFMTDMDQGVPGKAIDCYSGENYYITRDELYPIKEIQFGPVKANVPGNAVPLLNRWYGPNWKFEGQLHSYDHINKAGLGGPRKVFPVELLVSEEFHIFGCKLPSIILS